MFPVPLVNTECSTRESVLQMADAIEQLDKVTKVRAQELSFSGEGGIIWGSNLLFQLFQVIFDRLTARVEANVERVGELERRISKARTKVAKEGGRGEQRN